MKLDIKITVNGENTVIKEGKSVACLLEKLKIDAEKVAVEKNLEIIPQSEHDSEIIKSGDTIEIVGFIGGG